MKKDSILRGDPNFEDGLKQKGNFIKESNVMNVGTEGNFKLLQPFTV
jgi:hypothetical protein